MMIRDVAIGGYLGRVAKGGQYKAPLGKIDVSTQLNFSTPLTNAGHFPWYDYYNPSRLIFGASAPPARNSVEQSAT